jgi:hypothetical protein
MATWVCELMQSEGIAPSTYTRYKGYWRRFCHWFDFVGRDILGGREMRFADESLWLMLVAWEWKVSTFKSLRIYMYALRHEFLLRYSFIHLKRILNIQRQIIFVSNVTVL